MLTSPGGGCDEGERLAQEAPALGQEAHEPDALLGFGAQVFLVRRQQGRLDELKAAFESFVEQYPAVPSVRCGLAYLHMEAGRAPEVRSEFETLAANDFADLPHDAY